jgi:hypothetical protein
VPIALAVDLAANAHLSWRVSGLADILICPGFGGVEVLDSNGVGGLFWIFLVLVMAVNRYVTETSLGPFVVQAVGRGLSGTTFIPGPERVGLSSVVVLARFRGAR